MDYMFYRASTFRSAISKWDVSSVTNMEGMFEYATSFNSDISKWDVSSVTDVTAMFREATSFNGDISKWDVSSVTNMDYMFWDAASFTRKLCGASWVHSKARRTIMFAGSSGSIPETTCTAELNLCGGEDTHYPSVIATEAFVNSLHLPVLWTA